MVNFLRSLLRGYGFEIRPKRQVIFFFLLSRPRLFPVFLNPYINQYVFLVFSNDFCEVSKMVVLLLLVLHVCGCILGGIYIFASAEVLRKT